MPDVPWVRSLPVGHDFATYTAMHSAIVDHPYLLKLSENDTKAPCADTCQHGETAVLKASLSCMGTLVVHGLCSQGRVSFSSVSN